MDGYEAWPLTLGIHVATAIVAIVRGSGSTKMFVPSLDTCCDYAHSQQDRTECPICRTQLVGEAPLIPNITLDSLIEKHIELLISAGDIDWLPQGSKYKDRASRKA